MDKEQTGLQGVLCHMDDILVIGRNKEEHDERLVKVLQRLKDSGITLNPDKCLFSMGRLQYLGQVIYNDSIREDPAKVKAITELPELKDISDVRRYLVMLNQQMKFMPYLAKMTKPIQDLRKKGMDWTWDSPEKEAFDQLEGKLALNEALVVGRLLWYLWTRVAMASEA